MSSLSYFCPFLFLNMRKLTNYLRKNKEVIHNLKCQKSINEVEENR